MLRRIFFVIATFASAILVVSTTIASLVPLDGREYSFTFYESRTIGDSSAHAERVANVPAPPPDFSASFYAGTMVIDDQAGRVRGDVLEYVFSMEITVSSGTSHFGRDPESIALHVTYSYDERSETSVIQTLDANSGEVIAFPFSTSFLHSLVWAFSQDELNRPGVRSAGLPNSITQYIREPRSDAVRSNGQSADLMRWTVDSAGLLETLVASREMEAGDLIVLREMSVSLMD